MAWISRSRTTKVWQLRSFNNLRPSVAKRQFCITTFYDDITTLQATYYFVREIGTIYLLHYAPRKFGRHRRKRPPDRERINNTGIFRSQMVLSGLSNKLLNKWKALRRRNPTLTAFGLYFATKVVRPNPMLFFSIILQWFKLIFRESFIKVADSNGGHLFFGKNGLFRGLLKGELNLIKVSSVGFCLFSF